MRVAIEAATLGLSSGGLKRYTAELSLALATCFPEDQYFLVSDQPFEMPQNAPANLHRGGRARNAIERRWWLWGLHREAARLGAQLVHGPDFSVPYLGGQPSVMSLHDLSPWLDPKWHSEAGRVKHRTPVLLRLDVATMIITPGEGVRKQAIERFDLKPDRVAAVPEAAAPWLRPLAGSNDTNTPPYFLFVGTIEPRKNLPMLISAWREVRRKHRVNLVIAGRQRADGPVLAAEPGLELAGEVPDARLAELYSNALALVYPSHYEGFGLPVLEAMQCGAPVIASRAVAEVAGDAACYASGERELSEALRAALERPDWREQWSDRALARAREFSWKRTARLTREVYGEAIQRYAR